MARIVFFLMLYVFFTFTLKCVRNQAGFISYEKALLQCNKDIINNEYVSPTFKDGVCVRSCDLQVKYPKGSEDKKNPLAMRAEAQRIKTAATVFQGLAAASALIGAACSFTVVGAVAGAAFQIMGVIFAVIAGILELVNSLKEPSEMQKVYNMMTQEFAKLSAQLDELSLDLKDFYKDVQFDRIVGNKVAALTTVLIYTYIDVKTNRSVNPEGVRLCKETDFYGILSDMTTLLRDHAIAFMQKRQNSEDSFFQIQVLYLRTMSQIERAVSQCGLLLAENQTQYSLDIENNKEESLNIHVMCTYYIIAELFEDVKNFREDNFWRGPNIEIIIKDAVDSNNANSQMAMEVSQSIKKKWGNRNDMFFPVSTFKQTYKFESEYGATGDFIKVTNYKDYNIIAWRIKPFKRKDEVPCRTVGFMPFLYKNKWFTKELSQWGNGYCDAIKDEKLEPGYESLCKIVQGGCGGDSTACLSLASDMDWHYFAGDAKPKDAKMIYPCWTHSEKWPWMYSHDIVAFYIDKNCLSDEEVYCDKIEN